MTTRCSFYFVRNPSLLIHSFQEENLVATIARKLLHRCRTGNEVDLQAPRESLSEAVKLLVERGSIRRGRGIEIPVGALTGSGAGLYAQKLRFKRGINPCGAICRENALSIGHGLMVETGQDTIKAMPNHRGGACCGKKPQTFPCYSGAVSCVDCHWWGNMPFLRSRHHRMITLPQAIEFVAGCGKQNRLF